MANFGATLLEGIARGMLGAESKKRAQQEEAAGFERELAREIRKQQAVAPYRVEEAKQIATVRGQAGIEEAKQKAALKLQELSRGASPDMLKAFDSGDFGRAFSIGAASTNPADKDLLQHIGFMQRLIKGQEFQDMQREERAVDRSVAGEERFQQQAALKGITTASSAGGVARALAGKKVSKPGRIVQGMEVTGERDAEGNLVVRPVRGLPVKQGKPADQMRTIDQELKVIEQEEKILQDERGDEIKDEDTGKYVPSPAKLALMEQKKRLVQQKKALLRQPSQPGKAAAPSGNKAPGRLESKLDLLTKMLSE